MSLHKRKTTFNCPRWVLVFRLEVTITRHFCQWPKYQAGGLGKERAEGRYCREKSLLCPVLASLARLRKESWHQVLVPDDFLNCCAAFEIRLLSKQEKWFVTLANSNSRVVWHNILFLHNVLTNFVLKFYGNVCNRNITSHEGNFPFFRKHLVKYLDKTHDKMLKL